MEYSIEMGYVTEIIEIQKITKIPELPCYVKGIINLWRKLIPDIDARLKLGKKAEEYDNGSCTIVIEIKCVTIALIVDAVAEFFYIAKENIVPLLQLSIIFQIRYREAG